jgi:RNase P subunit RPR2
MICPNCNSEDIEKLTKSNRVNSRNRGHDSDIFLCLKCGLRFSKNIEKRYATKNI